MYTAISVAVVFMTHEGRFSYSLAMNFFLSIFRVSDPPKFFVVDRELALIASIREHFPASHILLCARHIEKTL